MLGAFFLSSKISDGNTVLYRHEDPLTSATSTDKGNPDILPNTSAVYEYYEAVSDYYYCTAPATYLYYHLIWVHPSDSPDLMLFLYDDAIFSTCVSYMTNLGWVIFRPSMEMKYYPKVHTFAAGTGYAYIQWEVASHILWSGNSASAVLNESRYLESYSFFLTKSHLYYLNLTVPAGGDFDFYLYYLPSGDATHGDDYIFEEATLGLGINESLSWQPSTSGQYLLVVVRTSGSGPFTVYFQEYLGDSEPGSIPFTNYILLGLLLSYLFLYKWKRQLSLKE